MQANPHETTPKLLTAHETAQLLKLPLASIYTHARENTLPGVIRVGRRVMFNQHKLEAWLEAGGDQPTH